MSSRIVEPSFVSNGVADRLVGEARPQPGPPPHSGTRHAPSKKPIHTPADMAGLKIRVPDAPLYMMFPKAMGANATPIAFAEVYLALQQGTVDGQENPLPTIMAKKFYEVQSHINLTGHITEMLLTIVSGQTWNKLNDADKKAFEAIFKEAAAKAMHRGVQGQPKAFEITERQGAIARVGDRTCHLAEVPGRARIAHRGRGPGLGIVDRVELLVGAAGAEEAGRGERGQGCRGGLVECAAGRAVPPSRSAMREQSRLSIADTKMIAVRRNRGCSRIIAASSSGDAPRRRAPRRSTPRAC